MKQSIYIRDLGHQSYEPILQAMQIFTQHRTAKILDEFWVMEHTPVFTQGQAGKPEHILNPGDIPVVQSDRGGQITYHGPGQLILYLLIDIKRKNIEVRSMVCSIEKAIIDLLADYSIPASGRRDAPGVYVQDAKICSLGLRIRKGCSYHGLSFNIDMDLEPFSRINPCGYPHLKITQLRDFITPPPLTQISQQLIQHLSLHLQYTTLLNPPDPLIHRGISNEAN
jgi:lipoyl(octanoyl) transferase